ncbi:ribosomal protein S18-alanine N-acetyltransferase [Bifidobacterium xylocopae]|uniref:Ribosomal-protein-alanine N-acetyltransferase n=1 Tax=Bifidobacterium xylocopae TaxID=2493119 RepID=A0A366KCT3_9BIFI|nr:ribosomal protein S18-alanine N-acetyltransferase [Bifidobacterium xylocopae]RBP98988.1 ribosomal-protein-alanine N-acetyltransferase [Bifidobacterium xylocopae]
MYRQVKASDLDALVGLECEIFAADAWTRGMLEQELNAPARTYLVYEQAGVIEAYGGFWFDGDDAELMTIGVRRAQRGRGIGLGLLERLAVQARSLGAARMLLEVRVDNMAALALYRSFGFRRMGLRRRYYQPDGADAYTMALVLSGAIASPGPIGGARDKALSPSWTEFDSAAEQSLSRGRANE